MVFVVANAMLVSRPNISFESAAFFFAVAIAVGVGAPVVLRAAVNIVVTNAVLGIFSPGLAWAAVNVCVALAMFVDSPWIAIAAPVFAHTIKTLEEADFAELEFWYSVVEDFEFEGACNNLLAQWLHEPRPALSKYWVSLVEIDPLAVIIIPVEGRDECGVTPRTIVGSSEA
jgi:hypothetical protein